MKRTFYLLAAAPLLAAAAPAWQRQALASARPYIEKANSDWTRAIVSGDPDLLTAPYATDGIFIGPEGSVSIGKAAVRSMYASRPTSAKVLKASIRSEGRVAHDIDDVYEWGSATMTVKRGDEIKQRSGRYLTVWHRRGEKWQISRNIAF
ncbi:MAG TPA: nuclear transport factor 2 family protein [Sphingomicrobium sp.]|nr:nuclear transport factor 2 family protein [Sphingomicrobium sp.]